MPKTLSTARMNQVMGYRPHPGQRAVHRASAFHRFRVADCGRRWGKSNLGGRELAWKAVEAYTLRDTLDPKGDRDEYWIVGPEYSDAEKEFRVFVNGLQKLGLWEMVDRPGTYDDPIGGNMHVSLFGGRFQVHAKSAKYPQTLVGEKLRGVVLSEAAKLKRSVWIKFIRPTLADYAHDPVRPSWALMASTPEGKNWFYERYMDGLDPTKDDWWSIKTPSWTNPFLFPNGRNDSEILSMEGDMSSEAFAQEIGAEFNDFVGRVFKDFDEEVHVGKHEYDPRWPLYIATDYGFTNPNVALFIQTDVWDNVWVVEEYYRRNRTSEEFADDLATDPRYATLSRAATQLYPDPEDPAATATLANRLGLTVMPGTGGLLSRRIDLIRRGLKPAAPQEDLPQDDPANQPRLKIDLRCKMLISEMGAYRYPEHKLEGVEIKENPLKVDDHAPEALGRFYGGWSRDQQQQVTRAVQRTAQLRRR